MACPILADNAQANNLCAEDLVTKGNMYFNVAYHYNKEQVKAGEINVRYVHTHSNTSDPLTKVLGPVKEQAFAPALCGKDSRVYEYPIHKVGGNRWEHWEPWSYECNHMVAIIYTGIPALLNNNGGDSSKSQAEHSHVNAQ